MVLKATISAVDCGADVKNVQPIDLCLSVIKPVGAKWINYFCSRPDIFQTIFLHIWIT